MDEGLTEARGAANNGGVTRTESGVEDTGAVRVVLASVGGDGFGPGMSSGVTWSNALGYAEGTAGAGTQVGD
ncbi:hypothetical protein R5W24_006537, partial [Gemmata sp. JC717]